MKEVFNEALAYASETQLKIIEKIGEGREALSSAIGTLPFLSSLQKIPTVEMQVFDEKHYFLIPYALSECGYTLCNMRILPDNTPPINDLPKKRIFHLPSRASQAILENLILDEIRTHYASVDRPENETFGDTLTNLANEIDKFENKLTSGLLIAGGLVALANPITGVGIAVGALVPKLGGALSRFGLKQTGKRLNQKQLEKEIKQAEEAVLTQFKASETEVVENAILRELQLALQTTRDQHDPLTFDLNSHMFGDRDNAKYSVMTCRAILQTYQELRNKHKLWEKAQIGPEDREWFEALDEYVQAYEKSVNSPEMNKWRILSAKFKARMTEIENIELIESVDKQINYIIPYAASRDLLNTDRYNLERLVFKLLPELVDSYLNLPTDYVLSPGKNGVTVHEEFISQLTRLLSEMEKISKAIFANDARSLEHLCLYLREKYQEDSFYHLS